MRVSSTVCCGRILILFQGRAFPIGMVVAEDQLKQKCLNITCRGCITGDCEALCGWSCGHAANTAWWLRIGHQFNLGRRGERPQRGNKPYRLVHEDILNGSASM